MDFDWRTAFLDQLEEYRNSPEQKIELDLISKIYGTTQTSAEAIANAIGPTEILRLRDAGMFYEAEIDRLRESGPSLSACVACAAWIECALLILAHLNETAVKSSGSFTRRRTQPSAANISQLSLNDLISISAELKWIPSKLLRTGWAEFLRDNKTLLKRMNVQDLPDSPCETLLRFMQQLRNYIHPNRFVQSGVGPSDRVFLKACCAALDAYEEVRLMLLLRLIQSGDGLKGLKLPPQGPR